MTCSHADFGKCLNNTISLSPNELIAIATAEDILEMHRIAALYNLSVSKLSPRIFAELLIGMDAGGSIPMKRAVSYLGRLVPDRRLDNVFIRHFFSNDGTMQMNTLTRFYRTDRYLDKHLVKACRRLNEFSPSIIAEANSLIRVDSLNGL